MAFRFKFDQLLRLAIHEEDEVKTRLAFKEAQIAEIDAKIARLNAEKEHALDEKAEDLLAGRMEQVRMYPTYLFRLDRTKAFHGEERERLIRQRDKILEELAEKRRVRKTYEKIRERHQVSYQKAELKRDQKRMDEFGSRLFFVKEEP